MLKDKVIIQDKTVDLGKVSSKKCTSFLLGQLIVPEEMVEACVELFDEKVDFVVIPVGMHVTLWRCCFK